MRAINDRIRAKRLLEARKHAFAILPFMRLNAPRYIVYSVLFAVILLLLALSGLWSVFGFVVSFLLGMSFVYIRWLRGQRNVWPFATKIINWDVVHKIAEDESSA